MLNDIQLKLMALYAVVEPKVQTHYLDRFGNANPEYMSDNETILLKDLNDYLVEASIIERGSEIPFIKVNGMESGRQIAFKIEKCDVENQGKNGR